MNKPIRIAPCCDNPECLVLRGIVDFLWVWGLDSELKHDKFERFFEVAIPSYWKASRQTLFVNALRSLRKKH